MLWANNVGIYNLNSLERAVIEDVARDYTPQIGSQYKKKKNNVFVITIGYMSGGHTRLMENLANMLDNKCDLIITGNASVTLKKRLEKYFNEIFEIPVYNDTNINELYKLSANLERYENIILNIHPDDIASVIAAGLAKKNINTYVHFVNHADHVFSFGPTVADVWYQISQFGAKLDQLRELSGKTTFLGIPIAINDDHLSNNMISTNDEVKCIITAGSANKYKPHKGYSLIKKIPEIFYQFPEASIIVVGTNILFCYWWWGTFLKFRKRIKFYKALNHSEYLLLMQNADIYLDSYPIPGGTAFVEQFFLGKKCAGYISPQQGYTPLENIKCDITSSELNKINNVDIIEKIKYVHSFDNVKNRFLSAINKQVMTTINWDYYYKWSGDINFFKLEKIREIPLYLLLECVKENSSLKCIISQYKFITIISLIKNFIRLYVSKLKGK